MAPIVENLRSHFANTIDPEVNHGQAVFFIKILTKIRS
jgi:hypothetical protein